MKTSDYNIDIHTHLLSAWAASRAASVKNCRFSVQQGRNLLEACGFKPSLAKPDDLPKPETIDQQHREWRNAICELAKQENLAFTHGIAAKLLNCYLKVRFVCGGYHNHPNIAALHPPIDKLLLDEMARHDFGGDGRFWKQASQSAWSKLSSDEYEMLINRIRLHLKGEQLWKIEYFWRGNQ